jgi:hypothetical protein
MPYSMQLTPIIATSWMADVAIGLLCVCTLTLSVWILRVLQATSRRWASADKRLSEVLWRTRSSDPAVLRKRVQALEEHNERIQQALSLLVESIESMGTAKPTTVAPRRTKQSGQSTTDEPEKINLHFY